MTIVTEKYRTFWWALKAEDSKTAKQQRRRGPEEHPRLSVGTKRKENQSSLTHQKAWKLVLNQL